MSSFKTHCEDCVRELGEPFEEVHHWLDEYFRVVGPAHRDIRHHVAGVEKVRQMWGDGAAKAAEIHIREDYNGKLPLLDEARMWAIYHRGALALLEEEFPGPYQ